MNTKSYNMLLLNVYKSSKITLNTPKINNLKFHVVMIFNIAVKS